MVAYTLSERIDDASDFVSDDAGGLGSIGVKALARHQIRKIDASRPNPNAHFPGFGGRIRALTDLKNFRTAIFADVDCLQGGTFLFWI
jgi:hypothetical protein